MAGGSPRPIDFGWFLPSMGDAEIIGPPTREATLEYLVDVAKTAEDAGFNFALIPVGTTCQDAWLVALGGSSTRVRRPGAWLVRVVRKRYLVSDHGEPS